MTYGTPCHAIGHFVFWYHHVTYRTPCRGSGHLVIYRECYGFEKAFLLSGVFYLTLLTPGFKASLGAGISTSNLTGLHADLWNIVRSDYSLEWQQSTKEAYWQVLFKVTVGRLMKNLPLTASNSFHNNWACQKLHGLSVRPHSHTVPHRLKVQCLCFKKSYRKYWLVPMVLL